MTVETAALHIYVIKRLIGAVGRRPRELSDPVSLSLPLPSRLSIHDSLKI